MIKIVGNVRDKAHSGDIFRTIESPTMSMVKDSHYRFLQLNICLTAQKTHSLERTLVYGNPILFGILRVRKIQLYIDATSGLHLTPFINA